MENRLYHAGMLRWIISCLLLAFSALAILANGQNLIQKLRGKRVGSFALIVGGAFGAIGFLMLPVQSFHKWWWIPPVLDFGSLPYFVLSAWFSIKESLRAHQ